MGQNHNHIYSAIAVKEIVPDSDINIYKFVRWKLCVALLTGLSILLEVQNIHFSILSSVCWFRSSGGCVKKSNYDWKSVGGKQCQEEKEGNNEFIQVTVTVL